MEKLKAYLLGYLQMRVVDLYQVVVVNYQVGSFIGYQNQFVVVVEVEVEFEFEFESVVVVVVVVEAD